MTDDAGLVPHVKIDAMVQAYQDAEVEIREAFRLLESAQGRLNAAFGSQSLASCFSVNDRQVYERVGQEAAAHNLKRIHRNALRCFIDKLGIRPMLSSKRAKQLDEQIDRGAIEELPPVSTEGLRVFVEGVAGNLSTYVAEMVDEVFNALRPRNSEYKRNSEFEIPPRVILSFWIERGYGPNPFRPRYSYQQEMIALDNVFLMLDGKPRRESSYYGELGEAIINSPDGAGETPYFAFRCYFNGNLHLQFLRLDLLRELNIAAGGNRLRGAKAA